MDANEFRKHLLFSSGTVDRANDTDGFDPSTDGPDLLVKVKSLGETMGKMYSNMKMPVYEEGLKALAELSEAIEKAIPALKANTSMSKIIP
jgi:hypothetical protein